MSRQRIGRRIIAVLSDGQVKDIDVACPYIAIDRGKRFTRSDFIREAIDNALLAFDAPLPLPEPGVKREG